MSIRQSWLAMVMVMVAGVAVSARAESADASKKVLGTWQGVKAELAGNAMPAEMVTKIQLKLTPGKYELSGLESPDAGTWELKSSKKPFAMDITGTNGPNNGKTFLAIFEITGDKMKICYDLSGKSRPAKFETKPKSLLFLAEYVRAKKGK